MAMTAKSAWGAAAKPGRRSAPNRPAFALATRSHGDAARPPPSRSWESQAFQSADPAVQRPAAVGRWRPSGRLGLAARPDQVVRAVLSFDQAGIDRGRERRIVEGHGDVLPPGLAGLLPRRADVVAGGLQAEVRGLLVVPLSLGTSLTLTLSVRVRSVPVKPSLSAVKVPMLAMMKLLLVEQGSRPSRPCCDPAGGDGRAAPLAVATQWRAGRRKEFVPRGMRRTQ